MLCSVSLILPIYLVSWDNRALALQTCTFSFGRVVTGSSPDRSNVRGSSTPGVSCARSSAITAHFPLQRTGKRGTITQRGIKIQFGTCPRICLCAVVVPLPDGEQPRAPPQLHTISWLGALLLRQRLARPREKSPACSVRGLRQPLVSSVKPALPLVRRSGV